MLHARLIVFTQMTKGGGFPRRTGWQDVADLDLAVRDDDAVDQEFDQLSALGKIQVFQGRLKALAEASDSFRQFGHIDLALRLGVQLTQLVRQAVVGLLHLLSFALEFVAANYLGQVGIQQPRLLTLEVGQRNEAAVREQLEGLRIPVIAAETGGTRGRTIRVHVNSLQVTVREAGGSDHELVAPRGVAA